MTRPQVFQRETSWLVGIFVLALALRVAYAIHVGDQWVLRDEADYCEHAINVLRGRGFGRLLSVEFPTNDVFRAFRMPLYPLFLAGIFSVWGINFLVPRVVQAVLGALACLVVYGIAKQLFGETAARLAGVAAAGYRALIVYSGLLMTEGLFLPLLLAAIWLTIYAVQHRRAGAMALAGVVWGAAILARAQLVMMGGLTGLALLVWRGWEPSGRRRLALAAVLGMTTLLTLTPWIVRNARMFGRFVPLTTPTGVVLGVLNRQDSATGLWYPGEPHWLAEHWRLRHLPEVERSRELTRQGQAFIREHPGQYARFMWNRGVQFWGLAPRFWRSWRHAALHLGLYAMALLGMWLAWRRGLSGWWWGLVLTTGCLVPVLAVGNGDPRVRMPVEPLLLLYAAVAGAAALRRRLAPEPLTLRLQPWLASGAVFLSLMVLVGVVAAPRTIDRPFEYAQYVDVHRPPRPLPIPAAAERVAGIPEVWASRQSVKDPLSAWMGRRVQWQGGLFYNMCGTAQLRHAFSERSVFLVNIHLTPRTFGEGLIVVTYDGELPTGLVYEAPLEGSGTLVGLWHDLLVVKADRMERAGTS